MVGTNIAKALGLAWEPSSIHKLSDRFITKRSTLFMIARFYDPLGLTSPFVTKLKIFLQALRKENRNPACIADNPKARALSSVYIIRSYVKHR